MAIITSPSACIQADPEQISKVVLMPGDPLRAKTLAETYFTDTVCFNTVRNMLGFTGTYKGKRVSVMGSGMGVPSMTLYAHELYNFFGVETILRIGSAGGLAERTHVRDLVLAMSAYTNSSYGVQFGFNGQLAPCCSYDLLVAAVETAKKMGIHAVPGPIYSSDIFYDVSNATEILGKLGVLAVEMEAYALYLNAAQAGKNALCICTISDNPLTGEGLPAEERQQSFTQMMKLALEIA